MSQIKRSKRNKNFTTVDNTFINDDRLSYKATGLLIYLLSKPDDWQTYISQLSKAKKEGKDAVMTGLNELIKYGYITRQKTKDKKGKFSGYDYTVYDTPIADYPNTGNPNTGNPNTGNPQILNTDSYKELNKLNTEERKDSLPDFVKQNREKVKKHAEEMKERVDFTESKNPSNELIKFIKSNCLKEISKYNALRRLTPVQLKQHVEYFADNNAVTKKWESLKDLVSHLNNALRYSPVNSINCNEEQINAIKRPKLN